MTDETPGSVTYTPKEKAEEAAKRAERRALAIAHLMNCETLLEQAALACEHAANLEPIHNIPDMLDITDFETAQNAGYVQCQANDLQRRAYEVRDAVSNLKGRCFLIRTSLQLNGRDE